MRVSCAVPRLNAPIDLLEAIEELGLQPIVTVNVIRTVYEGKSRSVADSLVALYKRIPGSEIYANYGTQTLSAKQKHVLRQKGK